MITGEDIDRVTDACRLLPEPAGDYLEEDFLTNLVATVVDFQTHTTAVERAIDHLRDRVRPGLGSVEDPVALMAAWPATREGNTGLAQHLWGYKMWTRAQMLRDLVAYFAGVGVTTQEDLRAWAQATTFADPEGLLRRHLSDAMPMPPRSSLRPPSASAALPSDSTGPSGRSARLSPRWGGRAASAPAGPRWRAPAGWPTEEWTEA